MQDMNLTKLRTELEAETLKESKTFYGSQYRIKTPLLLLNAYLHGGIPSSSIVEVYGEPKAGKSTFTYMVGGEFQKDHKDGIIYIIDSEKSIEKVRMEKLGIDSKRVIVQLIKWMEEGFVKINKLLDKLTLHSDETEKSSKSGGGKVTPLMIIWDTIAASITEAQYNEPGNLNAGGMNEKPRRLKQELNALIPKLNGTGASLWLINQVYTHYHKWGTTTDSGGGFGLKHGAHYKFEVKIGKKLFGEDDTDFISSDQTSIVNVKKTKSSPEIRNLPLVIDTLEGGMLDHGKCMLYFFKNQELLSSPSKGWFTFPGVDKKLRLTHLVELSKIPAIQAFFVDYFLYIVAKKSSYLRSIYFNSTETNEADLEKWYKAKEKEATKVVAKFFS